MADFAERFWAKVDRSGGPDACHPWTASRFKDGYGKFSLDGRNVPAQRVAFFLEHGRWPEPFGLHSCDSPSCCNARHVFEGTAADNNADRSRKGRSSKVRGEAHLNAKIADRDVMEMRRLAAHMSGREIAKRFRVSPALVSLVLNGKHREQPGTWEVKRVHPQLVPRGERSGLAKLTDQLVRDIRATRALCRITQREMAERFGVSQATICRVVKGHLWQHV